MKKSLLLVLGVATLLSCNQITPPPVSVDVVSASAAIADPVSETNAEYVVLGKKLVNPYEIKNINAALSQLKYAKKPAKIEANYYYVRLEPKDSVAQAFLESTREIYPYGYPLDYELKNNAKKYKESDYTGKFQIYWAAVPVAYEVPRNIDVKIIDKVFLPNGDGHDGFKIEGLDSDFRNALEDKALELFDESAKKLKNARVTGYGTGYVTVYDETVNANLPIFGVEVKMRRLLTTRFAVTYSNGYFENYSHNFSGAIDYTINWQKYDFEIKDGNLGNASTGQNNIPGPWIASINKSGPFTTTINNSKDFFFAHTFRAAFNYYNYNGNYGIKTPPKRNSTILGSNALNIKVKAATLVGSHFFFTNGGGSVDPSVVIEALYNVPDEVNGRLIFSTVSHELSHASHWQLGFIWNDYLFSKKKATLAESWAMGVEWVITNQVYSALAASYGQSYTTYERPQRITQTKPINFWQFYDSGSTVSTVRDDYYTPVFIDLMDNENQSLTRPGSSVVGSNSYVFSLPPNDQASGFTLQFLEAKLALNPTSWSGLKSSIVTTNPTSSSSSSINYLFDTYEN